MADRDPWERPDASGPAASEVTHDPWEAPPAAAAPQSQWGPVSEAANALLLGGGPTLTGAGAYLRGDDYGAAKQAAQQAQAAYEAQNPKTAFVASVIGGAVPAAAVTMAGAPVALAGGVMGAMPGVFAQDPTQTVMGGALGAGGAAAAGLLGKAAMAAGRGLGLVAPAAATSAAVPTTAEALQTGGNQFNALRATGATFDPAAVQGAAGNTASNLNAAGQVNLPGLAPTTHGLLDRMGQMGALPGAPQTLFDDSGHMLPNAGPGTPAQPVPVAELDAMRKAFGNVRPSGSTSNTDVSAARQGGNAILDLYAQNPQIAALSADARGNYGAGLTARGLEDRAEAAANGAQATGNGMNAGNRFRQAAGAAIKSDEYDSQPDVRAALQQTNDGTAFQNIMRQAGNRLGGGGGPLSTLISLGAPAAAGVAGAHEFGPLGALLMAAPPVIGHVAKAVDNSMAKNAFNNAVQTALKRSPAYAENVANFVPPTAGIGAQIGRALAPSIGAATANPGLGALFGN